MDIWIFQTGEPLPCDPNHIRPMRAMNLAEAFAKEGHKVTIISSTFNHQLKSQRKIKNSKFFVSKNISIHLIPSPGYQKNIGLARLMDHFIMSFNLLNYLLIIQNAPDFVFIGYPPIETAFVLSLWTRLNNVQSCLDVKDQYPETYLRDKTRISKLIYTPFVFPYKILAKLSMRNVDFVSSITSSFLDWINKYSGRKPSKKDIVLPLVSTNNISKDYNNLSNYNWWKDNNIDLNKDLIITFCGTLTSIWDWSYIKDSLKILKGRGVDITLVICGSGSHKFDTMDLFTDLDNVKFPGWINESQLSLLMNNSLLSIAPYKNKPDFQISIPNKIIESLKYGVPILTSLKGDVRQLIEKNEIGYYCGEDSYLWAHYIETLVFDKLLHKSLRRNAEFLYKDSYTFDKVYGNFSRNLIIN